MAPWVWVWPILWGSAGITVPWEACVSRYRLPGKHYGAMKAYIQYLVAYIDPETGALRGNLGDWLGRAGENDNSCSGRPTLYDLELMHRVATRRTSRMARHGSSITRGAKKKVLAKPRTRPGDRENHPLGVQESTTERGCD